MRTRSPVHPFDKSNRDGQSDRMNENGLLAALRALPLHPGARGLADDAAVLDTGGETLILTHDAMVEGVHWLPGQDMADVAWKLLAVNLSDLAAKGAEPVGVLLGYQLGEGDASFLKGLREGLETFQVALLGGDTVAAAGPRSFGLTAIGRATQIPVPARSGARAGDALFLAGPVGAAMLGFEAVRDATGADSLAFRRPAPRLAEGQALAPLVSAMMDVSDGLLLDAQRMAEASGVTICIDSSAVPFDGPVVRKAEAMRWGDDYALLFTAAADSRLPVAAERIGRVVGRMGCPLLLDEVPAREPLGYRHG